MVEVRAASPREWFDSRGLRDDLRAATLDASLALVVMLGIFFWLFLRIRSGTSATLLVMPFLADAPRYWMYWLCQAFGWSALLWAWITVMLGLIRSSRPPQWLPVPTARIEKWHRTTSLTTIALMFAHAVWFVLELVRGNQDGLGWGGRLWSAFVDVFVPGGYASGTGRIAILIGLLALYLAIPLGLAFYARRRVGPRVWQALHACIIVVYVLSVWHTLLYGTNVWYDGWFRATVWLLQLPVAALLMTRLLAPAPRPGSSRLDRAGRDGGRTPGLDGADLNVTRAMVWTGLALFVATVTAAGYRAHRLRPQRTSK